MVSRIRENVSGSFISIEHGGIYKDGKEIFSGPEADEWAGALENYTFRETDGKTLLIIDMDTTSEDKSYFQETWPKALNQLKKICEI